MEVFVEQQAIIFSDLKANQKRKKDRSKNGGFNAFNKVTALVRRYKETNDNNDLLVVVNALEGILNTFTLVLTPASPNQQIYITPYMKRFLAMFLSAEEKCRYDNEIYNIALGRVRWIMRHHSYEDVYAHILWEMISIIKKSRIIGTCDIFYYFQHVLKYKIHNWVVKQTKDFFSLVVDVEDTNDDDKDGTQEEIISRLDNSIDDRFEDFTIDNLFYDEFGLDILIAKRDIWKHFSHYEKYIIYLKYSLLLKDSTILSILRFETNEELQDRIEDIKERLKIISEE